MPQTLSTLVRRDDTFFGVCQAIGDDFGFNPNWLRVALALPVIFAPWMSLAAYGALAVVVIASRLVAPVRTAKAMVAEPPVEPQPANDERVLAEAA